MVPPAQSESGFYSYYFLIPKNDGLWLILDLRHLNRLYEMVVQDDYLKHILS